MADEPFATLEELQARLDFTMDETEQRLGQAALEDLSDEARHYGSHLWTGPNTSPRVIRTWVLKAAYRYMKNIEGYIQSRAGMEAVAWPELEGMGTASFTQGEIKRIQQLARPVALNNSATFVYGRYDDGRHGGDIRVPVDYGGRKFPLIAKDDPFA